MNENLRSELYGPISFLSGIPDGFAKQLIPQAQYCHAYGPWGIVFLQELKTDSFLLRHFLFKLHETLSFSFKENNEGIQSLLSLKGELKYHVHGFEPIVLKEQEFTFLNAQEQETITTIPGEKTCILANAYYTVKSYEELLPYFPDFRNDLEKALHNPFHFLYSPKRAKFTVNHAIEAIWQDRYIPFLEKKHVELRLESTLFTLLAQTYTENFGTPASAREQEQAAATRELILKNIKKQWTLKEIASELYYSPGLIKRSFSNVYGIGVRQFLRKTRMEHARELLLSGESLKVAAIEVGMKPRNFPKEFKSFFGYTVTDLKKGKV
jgi:AraC-like DNA-binding protein